MIKYMVIQYNHNAYDEWVQIVTNDISDIKEAENIRANFLDAYVGVSPDNVHVIQYRE